jgi:transcriptional regulator with XRE-family HTH domain|nr:MAG TPA: helix-turn-helix domain protein [Caudoviricetes sp.]
MILYQISEVNKMSVGSRIRELREDKELSRAELADKIGVTIGAVSNYENEVSSPKEPILFKIMEVLECDANYLFQDSINIPTMKDSFSVLEHNLIKKYRELDAHGKDMVATVLQKEYDHIIELRDSVSQTEELSEESNNITTIDLLAAHARTDVKQTPEGVQHDLDIMNDDSKWEE